MEEIQENGLYRVRVERELRESREMVVYAASAEEAEDYARDAAFGYDVPNVLRDDDWEYEDEDRTADAMQTEDDWEVEFGEEVAEDFRSLIAERFKEPEPVALDKLFSAGWKIDVGVGILGRGRIKVRAYLEGEEIGTYGFGGTVEDAVRDAAQIDEKLNAALQA